MSTTEQLKQVGLKHLESLVKEAVEIALFPALEAAVAKSENKFDDVALAALAPTLKVEMNKIIEQIYKG